MLHIKSNLAYMFSCSEKTFWVCVIAQVDWLLFKLKLTPVCDHWDSAPSVALWLSCKWLVNNMLNKITMERPITADDQLDCKQKHKLLMADVLDTLSNWWNLTNVLWFYFTDEKMGAQSSKWAEQQWLKESLVLRDLLMVIIEESHN